MAKIEDLSTSNQYIDGYIDAWETKADDYISTNKTRTHAAVYLHRNNTYNGNTYTSHFWRKLTINGTNVYETTSATTIPPKASGYVKVAEGYVDVAHESDGKKSVTISFEGADNYSTTTTAFDISKQSGTLTLTNIPRQANLTAAPHFTDEENPTITYSNPAGNAVTSLQACIADANGQTLYAKYRDISKTGSSYTFNLTAEERNALRWASINSPNLTVKFYVTSVIGGVTYYSTLDKIMTITNANPTISATIKDTGAASTALTGDANKIIKGFNYIDASMTATAYKGASIKTRSITNGSKTINAATGAFENVESGTFVLSTTDSRGYKTTQTITKTLINYIKLTCNMEAANPSVDGKMSIKLSGNYFNGSFGATNNSLTTQYRYKENNGSYSNWINATPTITGNTYEVNINLTGLNYQSTYTFQARAIDKVNTGGINTPEKKVKAQPVFDWGEDSFNFNVDAYDKNGAKIGTELTANDYDAMLLSGKSLLESGWVTITPTANTPTAAYVTFKKHYTKKPVVLATASSGVIGTQVLGASTNGITNDGVNIVVTRTNTTPTTIYYYVFGEVEE